MAKISQYIVKIVLTKISTRCIIKIEIINLSLPLSFVRRGNIYMNYIKELQNLDFKAEEAEIYLACLGLNFAKVSEIANEVDIPRTSIYVHLKNLIKKGYVKKTTKHNVEYFIVLEPQEIKDILEKKVKDFSEIVPQLEKFLDFKTNKPKVEYYDTVNGLIKIFEIMLETEHKQIPYLIESAEATRSNFEKFGLDLTYKFQKQLLEKNVITQGIITKNTLKIIESIPENIKKIMRQRPATVKIIDDELFPFSINLYLVYPDKSFIIVPQENFVISIQNKNIYKSLVSFYQLLYTQAEFIDIKEI